MDEQSISGWLIKMFGGGITAMISATAGRMMYHVGQVRKGERKFFSKELLWEVPLSVGMAIIGEGFAEWLGLTGTAATGLIGALAYMGPRGIEALIGAWVKGKK